MINGLFDDHAFELQIRIIEQNIKFMELIKIRSAYYIEIIIKLWFMIMLIDLA